MLIRKLFRRFENQATDGTEGAAANAPDIQEQIASAIEAATAPLKAKNSEIIGEKKQLQAELKRFEGIDPDAVRSMLQRFENDEEAKLLSQGKVDDVLNKRTERLRADYDKRVAEAEAKSAAADARAQAFRGRVLDDAIRAGASKAGLHPHAVEDALFRARASGFDLNDNGEAVKLGEDGKPELGKDGKSPLSAQEWLEGMKEKAPHWFPSTGTGSGTTPSSSGGAKAMKRAAFDALAADQKAATVRSGVKIID